ncbi:FeoB-associated Cys-rich membrane protein [Lachnospiraceae bacterium ZAX-1]
MATIFVSLVLFCTVLLIIRSIVKDKKEGKGCASCNSGSCPSCAKRERTE